MSAITKPACQYLRLSMCLEMVDAPRPEQAYAGQGGSAEETLRCQDTDRASRPEGPVTEVARDGLPARPVTLILMRGTTAVGSSLHFGPSCRDWEAVRVSWIQQRQQSCRQQRRQLDRSSLALYTRIWQQGAAPQPGYLYESCSSGAGGRHHPSAKATPVA